MDKISQLNQDHSLEKKQINGKSEIDIAVQKAKDEELKKISPLIIIKPAIVSFVALIITIFLDISSVPVLGQVTINIAKSFYPSWTPTNASIVPLQFWWLPIGTYFLFILIALKAYYESYNLVKSNASLENTDKVISSSMSMVDGLATALPLIGAAILLVSIKMGPEIFLGISVPFEIKALIILALAKLFEPVLDYIGARFQRVINKANELQEAYYPKKQLEKLNKLTQYLEDREQLYAAASAKLSPEELESYKTNLTEVQKISFDTYQNFKAINQVLEKMQSLLTKNKEHLNELDNLSKSIDNMAVSLNNENVTKSLDNLNSIVNK